MNLADRITQVANAIYQQTNRGQLNHIIASTGVVDKILPYHHYQFGNYQISVNKKNLEIDYMYEDGKAIHMMHDLFSADLTVRPDDITEEMFIGSLAGDYKIVCSDITENKKEGACFLLHHYVRLHIPDMYEKYKLLDKEDFSD